VKRLKIDDTLKQWNFKYKNNQQNNQAIVKNPSIKNKAQFGVFFHSDI